MAIGIVRHNADGGCDVWHTEAGHGGTLTGAALRFGRNPDGSVNTDWIEMACPVAGCAGVSYHPIGGGCQPGAIQKLFARIYLRRAAALGIPTGERTWPAIRARIKARVEAMDGIGRFRLDAMAGEDDEPEP
jgi:hypothetical protein